MDILEMKMKEYGISPLPKDASLAMAYVPFQGMNTNIYNPEQALEVGTVFQVLDKPFFGGAK